MLPNPGFYRIVKYSCGFSVKLARSAIYMIESLNFNNPVFSRKVTGVSPKKTSNITQVLVPQTGRLILKMVLEGA